MNSFQRAMPLPAMQVNSLSINCIDKVVRRDSVAAYFDRVADVYDVKHGVALSGHEYNFETYYEPFLTAAIPPKSAVLELGCGSGVYTQWLASRGCRVTGMDLSQRLLEQAKRRCPGALLLQGDCQQPQSYLPQALLAIPFDVIVGVNTFSYYPQKTEALVEYRKLLRPKGRLVLIDMNGQCPYYRMMRWFHKNEMNQWFDRIRDFRLRALQEMLCNAGFRISTTALFAFIPNGVSRALVSVLRPVDRLLARRKSATKFAMRIGIVAEQALP